MIVDLKNIDPKIPVLEKKEFTFPTTTDVDPFWDIDEQEVLDPRRGEIVLVFNTFFNTSHQIATKGLKMGELHQHSYRVQIRVKKGYVQNSQQMIVPYEKLRALTDKISQTYEGKILNRLPVFRNIQPTTENFVGVIAQQLDRMAGSNTFQVIEVTLYESPTIGVTYSFKDR